MSECKDYKTYKAGLSKRLTKSKSNVKFPFVLRITPSILNVKYTSALNPLTSHKQGNTLTILFLTVSLMFSLRTLYLKFLKVLI